MQHEILPRHTKTGASDAHPILGAMLHQLSSSLLQNVTLPIVGLAVLGCTPLRPSLERSSGTRRSGERRRTRIHEVAGSYVALRSRCRDAGRWRLGWKSAPLGTCGDRGEGRGEEKEGGRGREGRGDEKEGGKGRGDEKEGGKGRVEEKEGGRGRVGEKRRKRREGGKIDR